MDIEKIRNELLSRRKELQRLNFAQSREACGQSVINFILQGEIPPGNFHTPTLQNLEKFCALGEIHKFKRAADLLEQHVTACYWLQTNLFLLPDYMEEELTSGAYIPDINALKAFSGMLPNFCKFKKAGSCIMPGYSLYKLIEND